MAWSCPLDMCRSWFDPHIQHHSHLSCHSLGSVSWLSDFWLLFLRDSHSWELHKCFAWLSTYGGMNSVESPRQSAQENVISDSIWCGGSFNPKHSLIARRWDPSPRSLREKLALFPPSFPSGSSPLLSHLWIFFYFLLSRTLEWIKVADISSYVPICSCPVCSVCCGANLLWFPDLGVALPQVRALQMTASLMTLVFYVSCQIL